VGLVLAVGTEQTKNTYWRRMIEFFDFPQQEWQWTNRGFIHHWWNTICTKCQKWSSFLANVERMNPIDTNDQDWVSVCNQISDVYALLFL
jgi:hypothetical protein